MKAHALIDLHFPASAGSPEEAAEAAHRAGIDAIVYVADRPEALPEHDRIAAINADDGPRVHPACLVMGPGYRLVALLADWNSPSAYEALEAAEDLHLIHQAIAELGGTAIPICPRPGPDGDVVRKVADLPAQNQVGLVALIAGGSAMARDLDVEDASLGRRRVLGATGPFGELADVGRFTTVLPVESDEVTEIIALLNEGFGVAVEVPPAREAREDDGKGKKKKRRRRRRRKPRDGAKDAADGSPDADADATDDGADQGDDDEDWDDSEE